MGKFNRDRGNFKSNRFGGNKSFGGGRNGGRSAMHQAVCSECGASCELPFKPTGNRPVFCSNCFGKQQVQDGGRPNFGGNRDRRERPRFEDKQMHGAVCAKCGKDCQVPFKPMAGKSVFCDSCFEKNGKGDAKNSSEVMDQIKMLNYKIDNLIKMLAPKTLVEKSEKPEVKKAVKEKTKAKPAVKKAPAKKKTK